MNTSREKDLPEKPLMLVIEDDLSRRERWLKLCEEAAWRVEVVGSLENAITFAEKHAEEIRLVIVDIMIPFYQAELDGLMELRGTREELLGRIKQEYEKEERNQTTLADLDAEMAALDGALRSLIVLDGGLLFFEEAKGRGWLDQWRFGVCSATDRHNGENILCEMVGQRLKNERYTGWYSKPIEDEEILTLLAREATLLSNSKESRS
jgi:CheY-like chemotaxis protein